VETASFSVAAVQTGLWPYLIVIIVGFVPSELWRWLAVFFVRGINPQSELLVWVRAVATALLAAVVAKLVLVPSGALATVPVQGRLVAFGLGVAAFFVFRRSILAAIVAGELAIVIAAFASVSSM
jgi:hypothetical protein